MAKYIFTQDYSANLATILVTQNCCITPTNPGFQRFKKGAIYDLEKIVTPVGGNALYYDRNGCKFFIPANVVRPFKEGGEPLEMSYLGKEQLEKQNDNVKTLLIVVSLVAVAIVVYLLAKGKLFNSLKS